MSEKNSYKIDQIVNSIFEGDCIEIMKQFPDNCIDMILCDLPYGTTQNKWDSIIPLDELWHEYKRIIKENGAIVLTSQGLFTAQLMLSNPKQFKYKWVWEKSKPTNFLNATKTFVCSIKSSRFTILKWSKENLMTKVSGRTN